MNKRILLALLHREIGSKLVRDLIKTFEFADDLDPQEVTSFLKPSLSPEKLARLNSLVIRSDNLELLQEKLCRAGVAIIVMHDALYPSSLLALRSPPPLLYVKGHLVKAPLPGIGICGSRKASDKGLEYAENFGRIMASQGITEISGYAQGVDARAHLGALKNGGVTIAVIAEGILRFRHRRIFNDILDLESRMIVVSEFHPERPWHVSTAMQRNRTICGLSNAMVVVEAGDSGGTLDAGKKCLEQGKPLLVLRYENTGEMPLGNLRLIRNGGIPVPSFNDLKSRVGAAMSIHRTTPEASARQSRLLV